MNIILTDNRAIKWYNKGDISVKGYLFDDSGRYMKGQQLLDFFSDIKSPAAFKERLEHANGLFSVVIRNDGGCYAAVDIIRTFPLYYMITSDDICLSDEPQEMPITTLNQKCIPEFLACGYVMGENTLIGQMYQIQAGAFIVCHQGKIGAQRYYYRHAIRGTRHITSDRLKKELVDILTEIGRKLVASLEGRQAVLPLSAGYDSRLLAVLLKDQKYENVICFTFGGRSNDEAQTAEVVAKTLDYPWYFVANDKRMINNYFSSRQFGLYYKYASGFTSMFFMEQYFAIKYLKENGLIARNAVFIPGHSGDSIAGSHLKGYLTEDTSEQTVVNKIYKNHFYLMKLKEDERKKIIATISEFVRNSNGLPYSIYQEWVLKERQAKFIVNSARLYPFFGYEFRMPLWDRGFTEFFKRLPLVYKNYKNLYNHVLRSSFFTKNDLVFNQDDPKGRFDFKVQAIKIVLRSFLPGVLRQYYLNKNDTSGYKQITQEMVEEMQKGDYCYQPPDRSYNSVLTQWYIFKLLQEFQ
jgi:asparagine synthase (glutamine-hydrolysing)